MTVKERFLDQVILKIKTSEYKRLFVLKDYERKLENLLNEVQTLNEFNTEMVQEAFLILTSKVKK